MYWKKSLLEDLIWRLNNDNCPAPKESTMGMSVSELDQRALKDSGLVWWIIFSSLSCGGFGACVLFTWKRCQQDELCKPLSAALPRCKKCSWVKLFEEHEKETLTVLSVLKHLWKEKKTKQTKKPRSHPGAPPFSTWHAPTGPSFIGSTKCSFYRCSRFRDS